MLVLTLLMACGQGSAVIPVGTPLPSDGVVPPTEAPPPPALPACTEGAFIDQQLTTVMAPCDQGETLHAFAGAAGSIVYLQLDGLVGDADVQIETVYGDVLTQRALVDGGTIDLNLPWTGEFLVRVRTEPTELTLTRGCSLGCDAPYTRYPLFLMHGMAGTDSFLSVIDYWFGIADTLTDAGYEVSTEAVDAFQVSEIRAQQWADHLDDFLNDGRHRRVNLIGHSQGGLDARYVTTHLDPEHRVASVLTVGTPHHGVEFVGSASGPVLSIPMSETAIDAAFDALSGLWGLDTDQDIIGQLEGFDPEVAADFNLNTPDRTDVYYASWGGKTCQIADVVCQFANNGEIVTPALAAFHLANDLVEGDNDGLVSVESARWGVDYGAMSADHLDQIGLLGGPVTGRGIDPELFYLDEAHRLFTLGF